MNDNEFQKLEKISSSLRKLNAKIKLLSLLYKAEEEFKRNETQDCIKTCEAMLKINPDNAIAYRGLGCAMYSLENYDRALEYYKKALNFSTNKEIEYTLIGTVYYCQKDYEEAIKYYNLAIDINDSYDEAYDRKNQSILAKHLQILDLQDSLIRREINECFKTQF